jgi:PAS domain S-box-containing protein
MKLSKIGKVALGIAVLIMVIFFAVQTSLVFKFYEPSYKFVMFGWVSVITFMPFFFIVLVEIIRKVKYKFQAIDDTLQALNSSNAVVELDMQGNIISANPIFCTLTGYTRSELVNMNHKQLIDTKTFPEKEYKAFWNTLKRGKAVTGEFKRISKDGTPIWIYGNYNPIKDPYGETYRILKIASDITAEKATQVEVAKKNAYLEHAAKILRHDMHSGINTYIPRGLSSLKRRLTAQQIKELKIESPLKMIEEGLTHTQKVYKGVKEFTNLVKKDAKLDKEPVDLKQALESYLGSTSYIKQVIIEPLKVCNVNESLFCTAVDNLIRNGLKYNDSSTKVVKIYTEGDSLVVEDNGRGMTQEDFEKLSQPYARKENQKEAGSGLGLNICLAIMEEHGFAITAEKLQQGTKLRIIVK